MENNDDDDLSDDDDNDMSDDDDEETDGSAVLLRRQLRWQVWLTSSYPILPFPTHLPIIYFLHYYYFYLRFHSTF